MKECFICKHNSVSPSVTNRMFEDNGKIIVVKEIPCLVCENCGEVYLQTETMRKLEKLIASNISELEIVTYQRIA